MQCVVHVCNPSKQVVKHTACVLNRNHAYWYFNKHGNLSWWKDNEISRDDCLLSAFTSFVFQITAFKSEMVRGSKNFFVSKREQMTRIKVKWEINLKSHPMYVHQTYLTWNEVLVLGTSNFLCKKKFIITKSGKIYSHNYLLKAFTKIKPRSWTHFVVFVLTQPTSI